MSKLAEMTEIESFSHVNIYFVNDLSEPLSRNLVVSTQLYSSTSTLIAGIPGEEH